MYFLAYLNVAGLTDVGYRFYNADGSTNGGRITAGVLDEGGGWYSADATIPGAGSPASIRWDSTGTPSSNARESLTTASIKAKTDANLDAAVSSRATPSQVQTELTTYGALKPTTAGRTLDVSVGGEAGVDWANIGSPATSQTLSATTIGTVTNLANDPPGVTTLLSRITATLFTGITSLKEWLGLLAGKQSGNATARTEIRSSGAGSGTYDEATDSQEATRDNMGTPQTGDAYAIVNSGVHGNAVLKTLIDAIDDFVDTEVAAIKAKTDQLTFSTVNQLDSKTVSAAADSINASALAADAVNEIRDAVWAKAMVQLSGVPGVTAPIIDALEWIFLVSRNKITQTATTQTVRNDADSSNIATSTVSDDGTTFTRGKFA